MKGCSSLPEVEGGCLEVRGLKNKLHVGGSQDSHAVELEKEVLGDARGDLTAVCGVSFEHRVDELGSI